MESGLKVVDQLLQEVSSDCNTLRESFLTSMDQFKQLLDMREKVRCDLIYQGDSRLTHEC